MCAQAVGNELHPPKLLVFVSREQLEKVEAKTNIPVRLGVDFLGAEAILLVRFKH